VSFYRIAQAVPVVSERQKPTQLPPSLPLHLPLHLTLFPLLTRSSISRMHA